MSPRPTRVVSLAGVALTLTVAMGGCGTDSQDRSSASRTPSYAAATARQLTLTDGWVSAVASGMPGMDMSGPDTSGTDMGGESAAYATVTDTGPDDDAIVGVSTPAATSVTLHKTVTKDAAGTMMAVRSIPVAAGGHVTLQPGGYHVMLMGLKSDFSAGSTITMTWRFRSGATLTTTFPVIDVTDRPTASDTSGTSGTSGEE
ncbi:copper chaperone PCu(A)C [Nocardioides sp. DS6]|uniref:Copper chaperone PCu(A)C n=1 Tax=Nocardioides eburneus TaxID=3231482 RepID=A0ABV3SX74_9ACTN